MFVQNVAVSSGYEQEEDLLSDAEEPSFSPALKLFVGNLPFNVDSTTLAGLFERAGNVETVESYSPEDNRFDLRQFLYNARWLYQFQKIDELVRKFDGEKTALTKSTDQEKVGVTSVGGMGVVATGLGDPKARL
ncbi:Glutamine-dependent NAD(+) synthetase [Camellia lanceoleosa]|uniref:Glutamine-dependent NAD(+) synthetase n=1 Tax=Camellia lanceoleosa TaxID=1840588 RepID=A0ACC0IJQ3_9ERIC|nr:Glutamine-dependent NAD(+) synthetase [Camellia lanceoleosa]